jgi:alpha-ketoglutarate-dependent taurine dioxygenase
MKIKNLDNVGVEILDVNISHLSESDYKEIKDIYDDHLIVVFRNQPVEVVPFAKLCLRSGKGIANWNGCWWDSDGNLQPGASHEKGIWHDVVPDPFTYSGPDNRFWVQRVTGKKIDNKDTGFFPQPELDWHNNINGPWDEKRGPRRGVALQAVSGVKDTGTSFLDTTKAYAALDDSIKARCEGVTAHFNYNPAIWGEGLPSWMFEFITGEKTGHEAKGYTAPLVNVNEYNGNKGLYFHFLNECTIPSDPELLEILKAHCLKEDFIYTHMWEPGDIVISEQLLTLHKRVLKDPSMMEDRILHRYSFDM